MRKPWKADDPQDAMAESFRIQVVDIALKARSAAIFRDMGPVGQTESFMGGVLVALIGVCFASIKEESRDEMMEVIEAYLPQAREQAEAMLDAGDSA